MNSSQRNVLVGIWFIGLALVGLGVLVYLNGQQETFAPSDSAAGGGTACFKGGYNTQQRVPVGANPYDVAAANGQGWVIVYANELIDAQQAIPSIAYGINRGVRTLLVPGCTDPSNPPLTCEFNNEFAWRDFAVEVADGFRDDPANSIYVMTGPIDPLDNGWFAAEGEGTTLERLAIDLAGHTTLVIDEAIDDPQIIWVAPAFDVSDPEFRDFYEDYIGSANPLKIHDYVSFTPGATNPDGVLAAHEYFRGFVEAGGDGDKRTMIVDITAPQIDAGAFTLIRNNLDDVEAAIFSNTIPEATQTTIMGPDCAPVDLPPLDPPVFPDPDESDDGGPPPPPTTPPGSVSCGFTCTADVDCVLSSTDATSCVNNVCVNNSCPASTLPGTQCLCADDIPDPVNPIDPVEPVEPPVVNPPVVTPPTTSDPSTDPANPPVVNPPASDPGVNPVIPSSNNGGSGVTNLPNTDLGSNLGYLVIGFLLVAVGLMIYKRSN